MSISRTSVRRSISAVAVLAGLSVLAVVVSAAPARAQTTPGGAAKASRPPLYDTQADATKTLAAATARARRDATRVLVMFGFNTCGWCHKLHGLFEKDPAIRKVLHDEYALAMVDIAAPHAEELLARCKAALPEEERGRVGYPFLAVLDGQGKVVKAQRTDLLEVGDHHDPAKVKAFLTQHVASPVEARAVVSEALSRAQSDGKLVFLHFGAPWCGWCHKLDDFLARDEVAAILGRDYVDVKVDVDRMTGGKDVLSTYRRGDSGGIPWFVILDAKGKALATSDGPKGNIGYPAAPEEIEHFLGMLKATIRKIEPSQLETIREQLETAGTAIRASLGR